MTAHLVLDLSLNELARFKTYIDKIAAFIAKHSGRYIVRGVEPTTIEGNWTPERLVIIEFPERVMAQAFLDDPRRSGPCRTTPCHDDEQAAACRRLHLTAATPLKPA